MRVKAIGMAIMILTSFLFITGAPWYFAHNYYGNDWWVPILYGAILGVPALILTFLTSRKPVVGASLSIAIFFFPALVSFVDTFWGGSGIRLPLSLLLLILTYMLGASAILVDRTILSKT